MTFRVRLQLNTIHKHKGNRKTDRGRLFRTVIKFTGNRIYLVWSGKGFDVEDRRLSRWVEGPVCSTRCEGYRLDNGSGHEVWKRKCKQKRER